jgi:multidrug efflux pump subunit AcrB
VAALLMLLALAALFFHWRTVFIVAATIPVALIAAAWVLDRMGESFNVISFAGLAMALPVVIDEGIVAADAVAQRLRRRMDTSTEDAVLDASRSVRSPLVYATLIALLPVVPVAVMNGRPGEFFGPLVVAYVAAVAVAMLVAVTLAPGPQPAAVRVGGLRPGANRPSPGTCCPAMGGCWAGSSADPGR